MKQDTPPTDIEILLISIFSFFFDLLAKLIHILVFGFVLLMLAKFLPQNIKNFVGSYGFLDWSALLIFISAIVDFITSLVKTKLDKDMLKQNQPPVK